MEPLGLCERAIFYAKCLSKARYARSMVAAALQKTLSCKGKERVVGGQLVVRVHNGVEREGKGCMWER